MKRKAAALAVLVLGWLMPAPALAQASPQPVVIAVPPFATPRNVETSGGPTALLGPQVATLLAEDLLSTGLFVPLAPELAKPYPLPEARAPIFPRWRSTGASALVSGFVEAREDGRIAVGCYLHDIAAGREVARKGFLVNPADWRRAAHKCADAVYSHVTSQPGHFDTRIAFVTETGPKTSRIKRLTVMDFDGSALTFVTPGAVTAVSPRFSPDGSKLLYTSFAERRPQVRLIDIASGEDRPVGPPDAMSFGAAFSPDGRRIALVVATDRNSDIYVVDARGGLPQRLTTSPGADVAPSFSPDGSRIVFESDRSGTQQLYVMNADGSEQRRISFGGAGYASPAWSPDGERIAFVRIVGGAHRIGVMKADGSEERELTDGWQDEGPSWAPSSRQIIFQRTDQPTGRTRLFAVAERGGAARELPTPEDASDPNWSRPRE